MGQCQVFYPVFQPRRQSEIPELLVGCEDYFSISLLPKLDLVFYKFYRFCRFYIIRLEKKIECQEKFLICRQFSVMKESR